MSATPEEIQADRLDYEALRRKVRIERLARIREAFWADHDDFNNEMPAQVDWTDVFVFEMTPEVGAQAFEFLRDNMSTFVWTGTYQVASQRSTFVGLCFVDQTDTTIFLTAYRQYLATEDEE